MALHAFKFVPEQLAQKLKLGPGPSPQYLASYLDDLRATLVLVEDEYVDRHYLDEYATYYSRSFRPPGTTTCQRAHFFRELSGSEVNDLFAGAFRSEADRATAESKLERSYLGFAVLRPLPSSRLGRTVLATYPPEGRRRYQVVRPYEVNLAGLRLSIDGLAYQQQDRGAAVCASTALWSALQRVAHVAGHRSPTPAAITTAANSPFPASHGLDFNQMAVALSQLGYIADKVVPAENRAFFRAVVAAALKSHLPVILLIVRRQKTGAGEVAVGHAVTVTGYSEPMAMVDVPAPFEGVEPLAVRGGSLSILYVHDDNLGSHAHYELFDSDEQDENGHAKLKLRTGRSEGPAVDWWTPEEWDVVAALVPKPEKLRLPLPSLLLSLLDIRPLMVAIFEGIELHFDAAFSSGVELKRDLVAHGFDPAHLAQFQVTVHLPRHLGILTTAHGDHALCDIIIDVTEVARNERQPSILAVLCRSVPADSKPGFEIAHLCARHNWPFLLAPPQGPLPPSHPLAQVGTGTHFVP